MNSQHVFFDRTRRLVGDENMKRIKELRVIIFGIGGVGSWCAESLIRSGVENLTIVDSDRVCASNVNRQAMATSETIDEVKVEAMKKKLLAINPSINIIAIEDIYSSETRNNFHLEEYDYVVDAIDSLSCKAELILHATSLPSHVKFFSSMGAALKVNPTLIQVDEFWKAKGCPLARALRQRFKRDKLFPRRKFKVVYSPELRPNLGAVAVCQESGDSWSSQKAQINGSISHITAIFGFTLAGLIVEDVVNAS